MKKFARKDLVQLQCHGLVQDCSFSIDTKQKERDSWGAPIPGDGIQRGIKCEKETFTFVNMPNKKHFVGGANGPSAPERGSQLLSFEVKVNRSANGLSAWIGDNLLSVFFFEENRSRSRHNVEGFFCRCTIFRLAKPAFFRYNDNFTLVRGFYVAYCVITGNK